MNQRSVSDFRLRLDMHIVSYQDRITRIMRIFSVLVSLITIVAIIIYHGFFITESVKQLIQGVIYGSLVFYIVKYFILMFYSLKRPQYIKETAFEFILILLLIFHFFIVLVFPGGREALANQRFNEYYILFIQFYFLVIVLLELSKTSVFFTRFNLSPPKLMLFSFLFLIIIGTVLLLLPRMTTHGISFVDALFTSTSASCVTGLSVLDIGKDFTFKGQVVILILVQLGGMSILTFATFFTAFLSRTNTGLRYQHMVKDMMSANKVSDSFLLLKHIVVSSLIVEAVGTFLLYVYWKGSGTFAQEGETFFYAIFHAVSAFNNAGFSLWNSNFMNQMVVHSYIPQTIIMIMVFLGGIGFVTLSDCFSPKMVRERKKYKWKKLLPGTTIVLQTTFLIILVGTVIFFFTEYNHSLQSETTLFGKIFSSIFQIVSSRTAGFNTIRVADIAMPGMMLLMLVMFIGASPGSTGGGIKNTTFFVILKSVVATIKGKKSIEYRKKSIPFDLVDKAYSIVIMSMILIFISTFILALLEPEFGFTNILFESISAFTTSGLSTGSSAAFATGGKLVLVFNMYIGRIGTLTMAFALSKRSKESNHQYPSTYFMVG